MKEINVPFLPEEIQSLRSGEMIFLTGKIYTARDMAHKKMIQLIRDNQPLPIDLENQLLYYCGPSPAKPNEIIGAAGPTTSFRLDDYTEALLRKGLKGTLGKGARNTLIKQLCRQYQAVYLVAIGGVAALLSQTIKKAEIVAFPELGAEAIYRFTIEQFPCFVAYDMYGGDLFQTENEKYRTILRNNEKN
jgi:fumarate hydratase subunit beta